MITALNLFLAVLIGICIGFFVPLILTAIFDIHLPLITIKKVKKVIENKEVVNKINIPSVGEGVVFDKLLAELVDRQSGWTHHSDTKISLEDLIELMREYSSERKIFRVFPPTLNTIHQMESYENALNSGFKEYNTSKDKQILYKTTHI